MDAVQTGTNIKVNYTEPTTSADGSPLTDLSKTTVEADSGAGFSEVGSVPASNPNGGGAQSVDFTVPAAPGAVQTIKVVAFAYDLVGNKSISSIEVVLTVDQLAPAPPQ